MHLLGILIPEKAALLVNGDLLREDFTGRAAPIAEFLLDQRARTLRLHISGNGHHGILRAIMTRAECVQKFGAFVSSSEWRRGADLQVRRGGGIEWRRTQGPSHERRARRRARQAGIGVGPACRDLPECD